MKVKRTMRYYFTPIRIANTQSKQTTTEKNKHWWGCELNRTLRTAGGNVKWCSCYATQCNDSSQSQTWSYHIVQQPHFCVYNQNNLKAGAGTDICIPMFIVAWIAIAKREKQPKCPSTDKWVNKIWSIQTTEYYSALKRKNILTCLTTWIKLEDIC